MFKRRKHAPMDVQVRRLDLRPGDRLVLTTERRITAGQLELIQQRMQEFADGHEVAVLECGLKLTIVGGLN